MDILQLVDELEDVLDDASSIPFSKRVSIDPDEMSEIIKSIRTSLPEEIRQAKWVNEEKDRILSEANAQAQEILQQAQKKAANADQEAKRRFNELVNQHEITKMATQAAKEIVAKAEQQSGEIKASSFAYIDEILAGTQESLKNVIQELSKNRGELK